MLAALILAAGASTRMGRPKAALPLTDAADTFLWRLVRTLFDAGLPRVTIVTGAAPEAVAGAWPGHDPRVALVHNPAWERGQLASLLAGLDAVETPTLEGLLVALVDVPLVRPETVRAIVHAWRTTRAPIVRPAHAGRHGHPVIFDRALFAALRAADLGQGAKPVVRAHAAAIVDVPVADEGAFLDADTPDAYTALKDRGSRDLA